MRNINKVLNLRKTKKRRLCWRLNFVVLAYQTEIINKSHYEMTIKWLNKKGLLHNLPSNIEMEKTHLLEQLMLRAVSEDEISVSKASELLDRLL